MERSGQQTRFPGREHLDSRSPRAALANRSADCRLVEGQGPSERIQPRSEHLSGAVAECGMPPAETPRTTQFHRYPDFLTSQSLTIAHVVRAANGSLDLQILHHGEYVDTPIPLIPYRRFCYRA